MSSRIVVVLLVGFALGLLAAVNLPMPEAARVRIALLSSALLPLAVVIHFANLRLRCPSCRKKLTPPKAAIARNAVPKGIAQARADAKSAAEG